MHPDLIRAGIIAAPFWRKQAEQCQRAEDWEWHYKRSFEVPANFNSDCIVLQLDGLDIFASIYLNDKFIGRTNDVFIPYEFNISKSDLKRGGNEIEVPIGGINLLKLKNNYSVYKTQKSSTI